MESHPHLAFVYPGQGSQSVGMLADLAASHPVVRETFAEASEVLGYDLWALAQNGPEADLSRTDRTQPALLAAGVAVWRAWQAAGGPAPARMAGHSLGEYTALVCAGSLEFTAAVRLVEARGRYMQDAVPQGEGAMAAVLGLDDAEVERVCAEAAQGQVVAAANYNSPGQVVVAGHAAAVERSLALAKAAGAKRAVTLAVSVPSHCALMDPAARRLAADLADVTLAPPRVPVYHNADAAPAADPDAIRDALVRQLVGPVRWTECIRAMAADGARTFVEAGPGKVLTGLMRRIDKGLAAYAVLDPAGLEKALGSIQ
jgi:[acyl-carrier-protein] S-malonyltransferase